MLNASGAVVVARNPLDALSARVTTTLTAGRYYIIVEGIGKGIPSTVANGYTDYASLGFYSITGVINGLNVAPVLAGMAASQNYTNNDNAGVAIASAVSVSDIDSPNLLGGILTVSIAGGANTSNRIYLGASSITRSGTSILLGSVLIGRLNSQAGTGLASFVVTFTQDATPDLARQLIQSLRFNTIGNANSTARQIAIKLTDGDGGTSNTLTSSINIV